MTPVPDGSPTRELLDRVRTSLPAGQPAQVSAAGTVGPQSAAASQPGPLAPSGGSACGTRPESGPSPHQPTLQLGPRIDSEVENKSQCSVDMP